MELAIPGNRSSGELSWQKQLVSLKNIFSDQAESVLVPAARGRQKAVKPLLPSAYAYTVKLQPKISWLIQRFHNLL